MLSAGVSYSAIMRFVADSQLPEGSRYADKPLLSRHRNKCLGMTPKTATQKPKPEPEIDAPPLEEVLDETMRLIYSRIKTRPEDVKTSEAVQLLGHLIRRIEVGSKKSDLGARLAQINDGSASE